MTTLPDERQRLLLVDDEPTNLQVLRHVLQADYRLLFATDGARALQVAREQLPQLILLDIMMPGMDGYDTMRAIRTNPERRMLPMIALTAKAMKGDRERCLEAGASDYVAKPVVTDQLLGVLRQWLQR